MRWMVQVLSVASVVVSIAACGGDDDSASGGNPCSGAVPAYQNLQQNGAVGVCTHCHDSTKNGEDRNGAPLDVNFDSYEAARANADHAAAEVKAGNMPRGGLTLTAEQRQALLTWAACGTPQ